MMADMPFWTDVVTDGAPAGDDLEFDAAFGALDRAVQGKSEQQYGDTLIAAEEPDWHEVEERAEAMLRRTRDLRVLGHLGVAALHLHGLAGFAPILDGIATVLERHWDVVHPRLDPEDDNDPTLRSNALLVLADPGRVLRPLRDLPLIVSPRVGRISWRDIARATGAIEVDEGADRLSEASVRAAFADADPARVAVLRSATLQCIAAANAIPAAFDERAGYGTGPDLAELIKLLSEIRRDLDRYGATPPADGEAPAVDGLAPAAGAPVAPSRMAGVASLGPVTSRSDALHLLDLVCGYYTRFEPSSPLPLLITRARGLADKNFIDILRDIAPDALGQAQLVVGMHDE